MTGRGWIGPDDVADETEDTVPDETIDESLWCSECGMPEGECAGDCLYAN